MLLNDGLALLSNAEDAPMAAAAVRRQSLDLPGIESRVWQSDTVAADANGGGYEVRISTAALDEMRAEARRGRRIRGRKIETGGMLLGAIDDACQVINVDRAVGPPPDSHLSALFFDHGTGGTQEIVDERRLATRSRQSFVGLWHTHPFGAAAPSATDDEGMWELVSLHDIGRRALMIILGGDNWNDWLEKSVEPSIYARVSVVGARPATVRGGGLLVFGDSVFPGGFAYPSGFHDAPGRRSAGHR